MAANAEQKKEEFQKYLEKNGVIDQLTKVLVCVGLCVCGCFARKEMDLVCL